MSKGKPHIVDRLRRAKSYGTAAWPRSLVEDALEAADLIEKIEREQQEERKAFLKLCETLGIAATATAYVDAAVIKDELDRRRREHPE